MCGIAGYLNLDGSRAEVRFVEPMCAAIRSRGPDDQGLHADGPLAFGMRRLAIIDLSGGAQPMFSGDGRLAIVYNGETYNFLDLRRELEAKGHVFATRCDTEVVLRLYQELGPACLERLEGMFGLAVWDRRDRTLFLARDRVGKKPLFYSRTANSFVFGSEVKALLAHPAVSREPSRANLRKYLFYGYVPTPATAFRDIMQVPPGSWMCVRDDGAVEQGTYFRPAYGPFEPESAAPREEQVMRLLNLAQTSVERRIISDVPLGAFLSGGVDSSLVVALMCRVLGTERVHAFTIGFQENSHDESGHARAAARALGLANHHVRIFSHTDCLALVPEVLDYLDTPMADPSILPTWLLSRFTREQVTVALSGDGGDELFGGYPKYAAHRYADRLTALGLAGAARLLAAPLARWLGPSRARFLRDAGLPEHVRTFSWISNFQPAEIGALLGEPGPADLDGIMDDAQRHHAAVQGVDALHRMLHMDFSMTFPDLYLVKTDRASMGNSLEVRCPLLDGAVMDLAMHTRPELKVRGMQTKILLKEAACRLLPREIIHRPKMGFGIPLATWLRDGLRPLADEVLSLERMRRAGVLVPEAVARFRSQLDHGNDALAPAVWSLLVLQHWLERFAGVAA